MAEVDIIALLIAIIVVNSLFIQLYFGPLFSIPVKVLGAHLTATTTGMGNLLALGRVGSFTLDCGVSPSSPQGKPLGSP